MPSLVLDSGGVSLLAERSALSVSRIEEFRLLGLWPPVVPTAVLVECLQGHSARDALVNRLLRLCDIRPDLPIALARRAAVLRVAARRGSAVDAIVVAFAEPGGAVGFAHRLEFGE